MNKILFIGNFGGNRELFDGQTIKTKTIYKELANKLGEDNILKIDSVD